MGQAGDGGQQAGGKPWRSVSADSAPLYQQRGWDRCDAPESSQSIGDIFRIAEPLLQGGTRPEERADALNLVKAALRHGASPHNWQGEGTPLRSAVEACNVELVQVLLEARAGPDDTDARGVAVLHSAAFDGHVEVCRQLLQARASANVADQHGQTPLFFAPSCDVCEVLQQGLADINATNGRGQSALHHAGRSGLREVLLWLMQQADPELIDKRDSHGATAAYYARQAGIVLSTLGTSLGSPSHRREQQAQSGPPGWKPWGRKTAWSVQL